jgi:hypothetical protein
MDDKSVEQLLNELKKDADPSLPLPGVSHPKVMEKLAKAEVVSPVAPTVQDQMAKAMAKTLADFDEASAEILGNYRSDQAQLQDAIDYLRDVVRGQQVVNGNGSVPGVYVEGWIKACEVKASLGQTVVKLLDSKTRLIGATKAAQQIAIINQNNTGDGDSTDLKKLLSQDVELDLENAP